MTSPDGPRPRDPERTRARLLEEATREFAAHGYDGARVERVVRAAGVTTRMLYHYFGGKEGLYLAVLDRAYADIRAGEQRLGLDAGDPVEAMRRLTAYTFEFFRSHGAFVQLTRGENMLGGRHVRRSQAIAAISRPLIEAIGRLLARGAACGAFREGVDPLQLYVSIVALSAHHINAAHTLSAVFGQDLTDPAWIDARRGHAVAMVLSLLGADTADLTAAPAAARRMAPAG
jgi:AcrR family transcriptional regulator